ncbi:MAG: VOC family protein [Anaerolineae bacterium]
MGHSIVYFEIPADDLQRARSFYGQLFGWQFEEMPGMDDYLTFRTGTEEGSLGGGLWKRQNAQQGITNYIGVDDVEQYVAKIKELGGAVVVPKQPVPGMGWFAWCSDPEGNTFAVWENDEAAA